MKIKLDPGAHMPTRAYSKDAGLDIYSKEYSLVPAHGSTVLHTGVHIELPHGTVGMLKSKSGLMVLNDITSEGTIDEGYQGEILVKLFNHGNKDYTIYPGDKVSQLVTLTCLKENIELVKEFDSVTERGINGIGSTGR